MKIAFITSTLEIGKDGIADYTNRLSGYCRDHGVECKTFPFGKWNIRSQHKPYAAFVRQLEAELEDYKPDILSWQDDGNLFSPRRIYPQSVVPDFSRISSQIQVTVHETWEGTNLDSPITKRIKGFLQRRSLSGFLRTVKPSLVHTTIGLYQSHLQELGATALLLPMISNIPRHEGLAALLNHNTADWNFVFFGGVYGPFRENEFMEKLFETGRNIVFHHVGRISDKTIWQAFQARFSESARFIEHGQLSDIELSRLLQSCNFGVSTVPAILIGKSTVYQAFREHGLPVINLRPRQFHRGYCDDDQYCREQLVELDDIPDILLEASQKPFDSLEVTGKKFLDDLARLAS